MTSVEPSSAPNLGGGVDAPSAAIEHDAAPAPDVIDPNERVLEIPIRNELGEESDEVIYVSVNGLPDDVDKVVDVLKAERADLWRWLAFAVEYYRQQRTQQFERILTEGCSSEVDLYYTDDTKGRIALLNAYAAFKISQGKAEWTRDRNVSERLLTDAVEFLNRADRINNMADATWVNKGGLNMVRGHHGNAIRDFSNALEINPDNLMGLLGKGAVLFERKQFREARDHYIRAIRSHPGCSAAVRVALGLCFLELKQPQRAVEAFERAHELEPDNVDALVALSVLELGNAAKGSDASNHVRQEATRKLLQSAMSRLQRAFELEPSNSIVLNHLANHFFMKETRDHSRIENLVRKAYRSTTHERVQAEACYMLGRSAHAQANLDVAAKFYDQSLSHWPGFPLAKFNRAQLLVSTARTPEDIARVIKLLEELNGEPNLQNESDISYMLGSLYAAQGQHEKATVMLVRATEARPDNSDAWVEYAQLLQQGSTKVKWKEALRAWGKVAGILMQEGKVVPAELFCNQGVLQYKLGEKDEAMDCLYFALLADRKQHGDANGDVTMSDNTDADDNDHSLEAQERKVEAMRKDVALTLTYLNERTITIVYNLARVLEISAVVSDALALYSEISKRFPFYVDSALRQASISQTRGRIQEATDTITKALSVDNKNADAHLLLAQLDAGRGDNKAARTRIDQLVRQRAYKHDAYARLSTANLAFASAVRKCVGGVVSPEAEKGFREALGIFRAVLALNPNNKYAANGIGAVLAVRGQRSVARKVFGRVREVADASMPSVWINMAHVAMDEGKYDVAATTYEQCLKRFSDDSDGELLGYLANAKYQGGKLADAKDALMRALHSSQSDLKLWFNLALVEESMGTQTLNRKPEDRTLQQVESAVESLHNAYSLFSWLAGMNKARSPAKDGSGVAAIGAVDSVDQAEQEMKKLAAAEKAKSSASARAAKARQGPPHRPLTPPGSPVSKTPASAEVVEQARAQAKEGYASVIEMLLLQQAEKNESAGVAAGKKKRAVELRSAIGLSFRKAGKAKEHADWVASTIKKASKHVERQKQLEKSRLRERKALIEAARKAEEEKEKELLDARLAKEEKEKALLERAEALRVKNSLLAQRYMQEDQVTREAKANARARGKKAKKNTGEELGPDESDDDLAEDQAEERRLEVARRKARKKSGPKSTKRARNSATPAMSSDSSSDDDSSSSDEDGARPGAKRRKSTSATKTTTTPKSKGRLMLEESSDDDDSDNDLFRADDDDDDDDDDAAAKPAPSSDDKGEKSVTPRAKATVDSDGDDDDDE